MAGPQSQALSSEAAQPIIQTFQLSREFNGTLAVDGLDLQVARGELFGLVGPDGAGKSTTLRLLAGLLDLSGGSATVAGHDLASQAEAVKPKVGYMAQAFSLYAELTVLENLIFFAELFDVPATELKQRTERLLDFAGLNQFRHRRADQLSGGMRKKLTLACTLIHQPPILLLDEPTTGVDPTARREFWNILNELHLAGTSIIVSTPYMDEADRCSRVALMHAGRLLICDSPAAIRARIQGDLLELRVSDWQAARAVVAELEGIREVQLYGESLHVLVDSARRRSRAIRRALRQAGVEIQVFRAAQIRMEEAFLSLMSKAIAGG